MTASITVLDCEQGSDEWINARLGIPTASQFKTLLMNGRGGAPSKTRATYMHKLAGEQFTGEPADNWETYHTRRGRILEVDVRKWYEFQHDVEVVQTGFIRRDCPEIGPCGCSPDGLVGDDGLVEIKTAEPHIQLGLLQRLPNVKEHVAQIQGQLFIAAREWCDLIVYSPGMPKQLEVRITRSAPFIDMLEEEIAKFNGELKQTNWHIR